MLKKFTFLLIVAGFSNAYSQTLNFTNKASMNLARGGSAAATDGANEYIVNGFSPSQYYTSDIEKYNFATDSWSAFSPAGSASIIAKTYANAEIVNNKLYIFNGKTAYDTNNNQLEIIDLSTGIVTYGTTNPFPVSNAGSAVSGNDIYFFGGNLASDLNASYSQAMFKYNTISNQWSQLSDISQAMQTTGAIVNNKLYTVGGYSESNTKIEDFESVDPFASFLALPNWFNVQEVGNKPYQGKAFANNKYAQITAFTPVINEQNAQNISWLVSPVLTKSSSTTNQDFFLSFDTKDGYDNGALLEAYVITNWTGDITTSSKTLLSAKMSAGTTSGYAINFTNSGNISLASYPNNFRIAFKYIGGYLPVQKTTTFQIDNFRIFKSFTSSEIRNYDLITNTWSSSVADLPKPLSANALAVNGNKIMVSGDYYDKSFLGMYDVINKNFTTLSSNNLIERRNHKAEVYNNQLYVFGGNQAVSTSTSLNSVQSTDLSVLGTAELKSATEFKIYPNPATDIFHFNNDIVKVSIYTMDGKKTAVSSDFWNVNVSRLPSGNYIVTGENKDGKIYKTKLIKK